MKTFMKWCVICVFFVLFSLIFSRQSYAVLGNSRQPIPIRTNQSQSSTILLINQVRGTSCCNPGSSNNLEIQLEATRALDLPATFAFRFDALKDDDMLNVYKQSGSTIFEQALFLEITPDLAHAAGVQFHGTTDTWYKAQSAYLLGYSHQERKKLIDTAMSAFYARFHAYPKTTVAWMIDAWSLSYLSKQYGVITHELTREQWGTDSYTLYGGPMGASYFPSRNWPLVPATGAQSLPMVIVRQTIPDPVWNYGDMTNSTTSQPNDYVLAHKTMTYFSDLLHNALEKQSGPGMAVIGLENSMEVITQQEYADQLKIVKNILDSNTAVQVATAGKYAQQKLADREIRNTGEVQLYTGKNMFRDMLPEAYESWWITTPTYRARVIHKNTTLMLTDLRAYGAELQDPYTETPLSTPDAYWVVPFLVDGSRFRVHEPKLPTMSWYKRLFSSVFPRKRAIKSFAIFPDFDGEPIALLFPEIETNGNVSLSRKNDVVELQYSSASSIGTETTTGTSTILFHVNTITYIGPGTPSWNVSEDRLPGVTLVELSQEHRNNTTIFTPKLRIVDQQIPEVKALISPEARSQPVDLQRSFVLGNRLALQNRNPIQIVLRLRDANNQPTLPQGVPQLVCSGLGCGDVSIQQSDASQGEYYFNVTPQHTGMLQLSIRLDQQEKSIGAARISSNCRINKGYCLTHPLELIGFLATTVIDRLEQR